MNNGWKYTAITVALLAPWIVRIADSHQIEDLKATIQAQNYTGFEDQRLIKMWREKYDSVSNARQKVDTVYLSHNTDFNGRVNTVNIGDNHGDLIVK